MSRGGSLGVASTGVKGLDDLLGGGLPRGSVVLAAGNPGAGKTTFAVQFLLEGARRGERGAYLGLNEPLWKLRRSMDLLGLPLGEAIDDGLVYAVDAMSVADASALEGVLEGFVEEAMRRGAERVVVDSISALLQLLSPEQARAALSSLVHSLRDVTVLLIEDLPYGADRVGYGVEEFVVDGVLVFRVLREQGLLRRVVEIRKMRGAPLSYAEIPFTIRRGRGIVVFTPERPSIGAPGLYTAERLRTGVPVLDRVIGGGVLRGGQAVVYGPPGAGKSLLVGLVAVRLASRGVRVLYVSMDEPVEQVSERLRLLDPAAAERVVVEAVNPTAYTLDEFYYGLLDMAERHRPQVAVYDSMTYVFSRGPGRSVDYAVNYMLRMKKMGVTSVYTLTVLGGAPQVLAPVLAVADVVVEARPCTRETRAVRVVKNRAGEAPVTLQLMVAPGRGGPLVEVRPGEGRCMEQ